jgi:hypothetical protein
MRTAEGRERWQQICQTSSTGNYECSDSVRGLVLIIVIRRHSIKYGATNRRGSQRRSARQVALGTGGHEGEGGIDHLGDAEAADLGQELVRVE